MLKLWYNWYCVQLPRILSSILLSRESGSLHLEELEADYCDMVRESVLAFKSEAKEAENTNYGTVHMLYARKMFDVVEGARHLQGVLRNAKAAPEKTRRVPRQGRIPR